jgi:menaquinone-dependent protoporphyrinogen oxidase
VRDFLVIYGTTDGQTAKIAHALADTLRSLGSVADVIDAKVSPPPPESYRAIVVAASVHASGYQSAVLRWVQRHRELLSRKPSVFVSVCLGVLQKDPAVHRHLQRIMDQFFEKADWKPSVTKVVAGALPYTKYNFLKRWVMRRIVRKAGGDTDTSRDYEYTDWNDLSAFARTIQSLAAIPVARGA